MTQPKNPFLIPEDFGMKKSEEEAVAYNYFTGEVRKFSNLRPIEAHLSRFDYNYWIIAPQFMEGLALLGDVSKFATMSYLIFEEVHSRCESCIRSIRTGSHGLDLGWNGDAEEGSTDAFRHLCR